MVNATRNKDIHACVFMFWSGVGNTFVLAIILPAGMRMELIDPKSEMGKKYSFYVHQKFRHFH